MTDRCPCQSGLPYDECCGPLHRDETVAATATAVMRSRYSAFAVGNAEYLLATWHPTTRPAELELDHEQSWRRLEILHATGGGLLTTTGTVEFRAWFRVGDERGALHETSRFVKEGGRWFYLDGVSMVEG